MTGRFLDKTMRVTEQEKDLIKFIRLNSETELIKAAVPAFIDLSLKGLYKEKAQIEKSEKFSKEHANIVHIIVQFEEMGVYWGRALSAYGRRKKRNK